MSAFINIIGLTEAGLENLTAHQLALINSADRLIGSARLLNLVDANPNQTRIEWASPLIKTIEMLKTAPRVPTTILATGDPNWFGIGALISRHFSQEDFVLHPAISAFQLAAARMCWPLQSVVTCSAHGRDVANMQRHIQPGARILTLTSDATTLVQIADLLAARGYGGAKLTVLENLGSVNERRQQFSATDAKQHTIGDFYVLAIECLSDSNPVHLPTVPGLPDTAFRHDGQLSKRDVRATTLAKLGPSPNALLWDVGAGSGAIAIEWTRAAQAAGAICFERHPKRIANIEHNASALGVPALSIVEGDLPDILTDQPRPDAIFIGGAVADMQVFDLCWSALKIGGRLVANAVSLEGRSALFARQARLGGELTDISVSVLSKIGSRQFLRPRAPVLQWHITKSDVTKSDAIKIDAINIDATGEEDR